jgi:iron-sulfur cluster repair protein YtfE (RIC family)
MPGASTDERAAIRMFAEHEHDELAAGIDRIHELAEDLATLPVDQTATSVHKVLKWIDADVKPHMAWEESWLFPQLDARARTPWATRLVRFDHQQIAAQAHRLHAHCASRDRVTLVADLFGLEALLRANVEREERLLLPLLEPEAERWAPEWRD